MKTQINLPALRGKVMPLPIFWLLLPFVVLIGESAVAQSPNSATPLNQGTNKAEQSTEQSNLVDGLLDLIEKADASKQTTQPDSKQDRVQPAIPRGKESSNPLLDVRERMRAAAGFLQQGRSDQQTVELQSSIVSDLDELIGQLEQQQQSSQQSSNQRMQQMQQQQRAQQNKSQQSGSSKEQNGSAKNPNDANGDGTESGNDPSNLGQSADPGLRRNDPAALQQSVWGHLPDRVRSQMQSRMVEEFLPSYRQHIEAYYRALLEEGGKK